MNKKNLLASFTPGQRLSAIHYPQLKLSNSTWENLSKTRLRTKFRLACDNALFDMWTNFLVEGREGGVSDCPKFPLE